MKAQTAGAPGRRARTAVLVAGLLVGLALGLAGLGVGFSRAPGTDGRADSAFAASAAQPPTAGDAFTPELGLPATDVVAIGAAPQESPGEVWAYGSLGDVPANVGGREYKNQYTLLERTDATGWQVVPLPPDAEGEPLAAPTNGSATPAQYGALAGETTTAGGVVLLSGQNVVVRDPDGAPRLAPTPEAIGAGAGAGENEVLAPGESLGSLAYAAIEDAAGAPGPHTGVLIAPANDGGATNAAGEPSTQPGVLHYDGRRWTREPIEQQLGKSDNHFTALALACGGTSTAPASSSPQSCWLLASVQTGGATTMLLFQRQAIAGAPSEYVWKQAQVSGWPFGEQLPSGMSQAATVAPLGSGAQMLTATAQGVWVDFQADINPPAIDGAQSPSDVSELVTPTAGAAKASVLGPWCYPTGPGCAERTLGAPLPAQYRSFAWPGASPTDPGARVITGLPDRAMLELADEGGGDGGFSYIVGPGGEAGGAPGAAAFAPPREGAPWEGWIADGASSATAADGEGQSQVIALAPSGAGDALGEESVPFRRPLYAVAQAPGTTPGDPGAPAIAVGEQGQIAHYTSGEGWRPEALYDSAGTVQTPTLRGVAWPEPGRAYAVGDNGAMWVWRTETGLWEPDPAKPFNFIGNLTAIAFSPSEPELGYAVGKQGALLKYGKSWEQVPLPAELQQVNFTSVTFAGGEALATFRTVVPDPEHPGVLIETGGVAVEEAGSGPEAGLHWHLDTGASALLAELPARDRVLAKIAGLPDGGVVAAGPGKVIERESASANWRFSPQPLPEAQNVSALAAYRDSTGTIRAIVSIDLDQRLDPEFWADILEQEDSPFKGDIPPPTGPGQPPPFFEPDPLPNSGYLLAETANGWNDLEHAAQSASGSVPADMPIRPDPVLALLVNSSGSSGLAVGGQTGDLEGRGLNPELHFKDVDYQTAAALRFPASLASPDGTASSAAVVAPPGKASFVVAGQAACAQENCADFANEDLGPNTWLTHALQSANQIAAGSSGNLLGFLYTGGRLPTSGGGEEFSRELNQYQALLGDGGSLPVHAADSHDVGQFAPGSTSGSAFYSFPTTSPGGGAVIVIVLDYSSGTLGTTQQDWLREQLEGAKKQEVSGTNKPGVPAIVIGNDALGFSLPHASSSGASVVTEAEDASTVSRILVEEEASAYFFDYPGSNVETRISYGGHSIPVYGTGTLGYVSPPNERFEADSLGSSGFLLASVNTAVREPGTQNVAPVGAEVIPNIGQLALDATDGVLLRRSQVGLFDALARRPLAGVSMAQSAGGVELAGPDPYDQIPFNCQGPNCAYEVPTQYTFTSSNPDIADFVAHEAASNNPRQVELGPDKLPVPDSHSGLLCAYNAGTTIVSITTGGLTYSEPVTVQGGSVEYPCGTVPLKSPPRAITRSEANFSPPGVAPAGAPPASPQLQAVPPPPLALPAPSVPPVAPPKPAPTPFLAQSPLLAAVPVIVPPLSPTIARPIPPSGTAEVFEPMPVAQKEREEESAEETVNQFSAYRPDEEPQQGPWPLLALLVIAAGAGVAIGRSGPGRIARRRNRPAFARAGARRPRPPRRWHT